jgi:acyl phosphate:glycerol-3-phosphate acyltransferase
MNNVLWLMPLAVPLFGYLLGSIPFGLLLTRLGGGGDLRTIGSGNIGATNVLRTGRKGLAALTLLLDAAKGVIPVLTAQALAPQYAAIAGLAAMIGHCYPVWLGFRGGKGVATALGVLLAFAPLIVLIAAFVWGVALAVSRIVSLSSIAAALSAPIAAFALGRLEALPLTVTLAVLLIWKHRPNVARLRAGTEPRLGQKPL